MGRNFQPRLRWRERVMGLVDVVKNKVSQQCLTRRCRRGGCSISLQGSPNPRLIIDFDKPGSPLGQSDTRCDFLLIAEENGESAWVAPLELKSGRMDASEVLRQLREGARAAVDVVPQTVSVRFRPVAAHRGIHKAERNKLRRKTNRIRFHGTMEYVRLMPCGEQLVQALRQSQQRNQ